MTTTYTLAASNSAGSASASTKVTVVIPERLQWKRTMVYGFGTLISEERPEGTIYVQGDHVGSPNILTNASGAVVGRSKNLPFWERFGSSGEKASRRYTNHEDQDGSAIYMQARTYLPAYGKFAQVDPAYDQTKDDPESWNLYNYVTNNPVTHTDPDGREASLTATNQFGERVLVNLNDAEERQLRETGRVTVNGATFILPGGMSLDNLPRNESRAPSAKTSAEPKKPQTAQTGVPVVPGERPNELVGMLAPVEVNADRPGDIISVTVVTRPLDILGGNAQVLAPNRGYHSGVILGNGTAYYLIEVHNYGNQAVATRKSFDSRSDALAAFGKGDSGTNYPINVTQSYRTTLNSTIKSTANSLVSNWNQRNLSYSSKHPGAGEGNCHAFTRYSLGSMGVSHPAMADRASGWYRLNYGWNRGQQILAGNW